MLVEQYNHHYPSSQATKCSQPVSYTGPINYSTPLVETCTLIHIKSTPTLKQRVYRFFGI